MNKIILLLSSILLSCSTDDVTQQIIISGNNKAGVSFENLDYQFNEGSSQVIKLFLNKPSTEVGFISVSYESNNAIYDINFTANPAPVSSVITLPLAVGDTVVSFTIQSLESDDLTSENIDFSIIDASSSIAIENADATSIFIKDLTEAPPTEETLAVVTWNIKFFPVNGTTTLNAVKNIILAMDADIIALQEIDDIVAFNTLVASLDGWEGKLYDVRGGIELAYLYKTSEITSFSNLSVIYNDDRDPFPRQPVLATAKHINGLEFTLINLHLKCCDDGEGRRGVASTLLKSYIDDNMPTQNVIVLGDLNDDLKSGSPFSNFINDSNNYYFADMDVANGTSANWSYPSYPSHIDHILITNELVDNFVTSETLRLDVEVSGYTSNVSDHRPVSAYFTN